MRANKYVKEAGPFQVASISQDGYGVRLIVYPAFPEYEEDWAIRRQKGDGGGPGIVTCIALAKELEKFLNQPYRPEDVAQWKATLEKALKKVIEKANRSFARMVARQNASE